MIRSISLLILALFISSAVYAEGVPEPVMIPLQHSEGESSVAWDFFFPSEELSAISFGIDTEGPKPLFVINFIDDQKEFYYSFASDTIGFKYEPVPLSSLYSVFVSPDEPSESEIVFRYGDREMTFYYNSERYSLKIKVEENEFFEQSEAVFRKPKSSDRLKQLSGATIEDTFKQLRDLMTYAKAIGIEVQDCKSSLDELFDFDEEELEDSYYYYY